MSSIFDVEPPRWLQAIAKPPPHGELGELLGQGLGGVVNAMQDASRQNEKVDAQIASGQPEEARSNWLKELPRGLAEARLNLADPLWRVKMAQQGALVAQRQAQAELAMQKADLMAHQSQVETEDAPKFTEWMKAFAANPDAPFPDFGSPKYLQMAKQIKIESMATKNRTDIAELKAKTEGAKIDAANSRFDAKLDEQQYEFDTKNDRLRKYQESQIKLNEARATQASLPKQTPEQKDFHRKADAVWKKFMDANATLQGFVGMSKGGSADPLLVGKIDQAREKRDAYGREYQELMQTAPGAAPAVAPSTAPVTNAPAQVGRFKVTPVPTPDHGNEP